MGYWGHIPLDPPEPPVWGLPAAVVAQMEGRGTGVYGATIQGPGMPFNYGWPKYGPVSSELLSESQQVETRSNCGDLAAGPKGDD